MRRLALLALLVAAAAQENRSVVKRIATVDHAPVVKMSGIVASPTYDCYWVHNDSGDAPRLFALDNQGRVIVPLELRAKYMTGLEPSERKQLWPGVKILNADQVDWEDVAIAGDRLYIADMGNHGNARRDLGVYVVPEPNPYETAMVRSLRFHPVRYPGQKLFPAKRWEYDCEAIFVADGKLYFLTLHRKSSGFHGPLPGTRLYRLDTEFTEEENVLTLVDRRDDLTQPSAADVSPDGTMLAVLTKNAIWVFAKPEKGDVWLRGEARRLLLPESELPSAQAVCWDDAKTLRIANERNDVFRVALADIKPYR